MSKRIYSAVALLCIGCAEKQIPEQVAPSYNLKDTRHVIGSADSIVVTYTDQWQKNLLGKAVQSASECSALASTLCDVQFIDATGQMMTNQYAIELDVRRNGDTIAKYMLHGSTTLSFEKSGRWYVADLGSLEFAKELERRLLQD